MTVTAATPNNGVAELVTVPNVELFSVGTWTAAIGGTRTITEQDLAEAVAASRDPGIPTPRIKIGHTDPRFTDPEFGADGEPSLGKVTNLRLSADSQTLIGDYEGVPRWLAAVMSSAYPSRSVEGFFNFQSEATTRTYGFAILACSLLGVTIPAVACLADLKQLYSPEGPEVVIIEPIAAQRGKLAASKNGDARIAASTNVEDIQRAFYAEYEREHPWWWIRSVMLEPNQLIVDPDDASGQLLRIPFTVGTDGTISFDEPAACVVDYVDVPAADKPVAASLRIAASYANRSESRPATNNQEDTMDPKILESLGLAADATPEQVATEVARLKALDVSGDETPVSGDAGNTAPADANNDEAPVGDDETPAETPSAVLPEGVVPVDAERLARLESDAAQGVAARKAQLTAERDSYLNSAQDAGKFSKAQRPRYEKLMLESPTATRELIEAMPKGAVPVDGEIGTSNTNTPDMSGAMGGAGVAYPKGWLNPQEQARVEAAAKGA